MSDFFDPAGRGVQHATLRATNRRAVLTTITFNPGISNADVSRRTGLAPQTASAIVVDLEHEGLIRRGAVLRGRRGQPATPLYLNFDAGYSIGCEVGWRHFKVTLVNLGSREIGRFRRDYDYPRADTIIADVKNAIDGLLAKLTAKQLKTLVGIGLASPTNIGRNIDLIGAPQEAKDAWENLDLRAELEAATGLHTQWFNDGNAACWAELTMQPSPRPSSFIHLFVSSFLAAGIVAEHALWEGPTGNSANLGSMLVSSPDGKWQFGHLVASMVALEQRLAAHGIAMPRSNPLDWPWDQWEPHVEAWLTEAGQALAEIILNAAAVIEVERAVIDGVMPRPITARLLAKTQESIDALPILTFERPELRQGNVGSPAIAFGAAQLPVFRKLFSRALGDMLG